MWVASSKLMQTAHRRLTDSIHVEQKVISDAMRDMLEAFRLPGEAQQIDRITETFAQIYVAANPGASSALPVDASRLRPFAHQQMARSRTPTLPMFLHSRSSC